MRSLALPGLRPAGLSRSPSGTSRGKRRRGASRSSGLQITRVGIWYLLAAVVVTAAAINTGNNGLFLTVAALVASFIVAQVLSALNLAALAVEVSAEQEIYAKSLASLEVQVRNRSPLLPAWLLLVQPQAESFEPPERRWRRSRPWFVPFLPAKGVASDRLDLFIQRRGVRRLRFLSLSSLFPLGLFHKERRYAVDVEVLVYPEIYPTSARVFSEQGRSGDLSARRAGFGYELHTLRSYQPGDDPRAIHWKQSARQQALIVQQRQSEQTRRLRIVFDNAVGDLADDSAIESFERLVSEAASTAVEALDNGYEVGLLTREAWFGYASGDRQRRSLLEALARIEALPVSATPLIDEEAEPQALQLRLGGGGPASP